MQIGMFTAMQWSPAEDPGTVLACLKEQVRVARNNGFKGLMVGQHVLTGPMGMFQLTPLLGALAEEAMDDHVDEEGPDPESPEDTRDKIQVRMPIIALKYATPAWPHKAYDCRDVLSTDMMQEWMRQWEGALTRLNQYMGRVDEHCAHFAAEPGNAQVHQPCNRD